MKRFLAVIGLAVAAIVLPVSIAQAQPKKYPGNSHDERVAAFMADPEHADTVAKARAGDPGSMYALAELIDRTLVSGDYNSTALLEMRMKLLAGAMAKDWAPAYLKVGRMVRRNELPEGSILDAYGYFLKGAQLGNMESISEAWRIARNPSICSICRESGGQTFLNSSTGKTLLINEEATAAGKAYLAEKRKMVDEVEATMLAKYSKRHDIAAEGLATLYLNGVRAIGDPYDRYGLYGEWVVRPDGTKAEALLREVADNGTRDGWAAFLLGLYYAEPRDTGIVRNPAESIRYLERATLARDKNAADAAQFLGHELVTGKLYTQDMPKALEMLKFAADKGHLEAIYDLGLLNMLGKGIDKNPHQAAAYFRQAIDKGHAPSATAMGQMYRDGDLGKVDRTMMNYYFGKASELEARTKAGQETLDAMNALVD